MVHVCLLVHVCLKLSSSDEKASKLADRKSDWDMPPCMWMAGGVPCTELGYEHMVQGVVAARIAERSQRMTERLGAARRVYADLLPARTPGHVVANVHCMTGACSTNQPVLPVPTELQIAITRPAETGTLRPLLALMLLVLLHAYFCTSRCNAESG
jgi:hypothetical protein